MKGFERLKRLGLADKLPRPVAVQPSACSPTVRAFETGKPVAPWTHQPTAASALNDTLAGYERDGDYTLTWIRRHGGAAVAVSDDEISAWFGRIEHVAPIRGLIKLNHKAAPAAYGNFRGW